MYFLTLVPTLKLGITVIRPAGHASDEVRRASWTLMHQSHVEPRATLTESFFDKAYVKDDAVPSLIAFQRSGVKT